MILSVDISYFKGNLLSIPNMSVVISGIQGSQQTANVSEFLRLMSIKEPIFLTEVLGKELYSQFKTEIAKDNPDQKWQDLKASMVDSTLKISPFANYCWYWWSRDTATQSSDTGETKQSKENAKNVSPAGHQTLVWNQMVDLLANVTDYIKSESSLSEIWEPDIYTFVKINTFNI